MTSNRKEADPLDTMLAGMVSAAAMLIIICGWLATSDYRWAVYGAAGWFAGMLVVFSSSAYRQVSAERRRTNPPEYSD